MDTVRQAPGDDRPDRLVRFDAVERASDVARWMAAHAAGYAIEIHDDEELSVAASPALRGPSFNRALGLRQVPDRLPGVLDAFRRARTPGWIADVPPAPGAVPVMRLAVHTVATGDALVRARAIAEPAMVVVREVAGDEVRVWSEVMVGASDLGGAGEAAWRTLLPHLAVAPGHHFLLAELAGEPVGVGLLVVRRGVGLLRSGAVVPDARRRHVHTALIAARVRRAAALGCDALMSVTGTDTPGSPESLARFGFAPLGVHVMYRFDPGGGRSAGHGSPDRPRDLALEDKTAAEQLGDDRFAGPTVEQLEHDRRDG